MAKEFEIVREVELPGTPEDGLRGRLDRRGRSRRGCSPPRAGSGGTSSRRIRRTSSWSARKAPTAGSTTSSSGSRPRGDGGLAALRPQRRLRRGGLGQPVRRREPAHRLLPAHARPVPRALQPAHGDLRRRRARRPDGPRGVDGARRLHQAAGRARRARGRLGRRQRSGSPTTTSTASSTTGPTTSSASAPTRRCTASSAATRSAARSA